MNAALFIDGENISSKKAEQIQKIANKQGVLGTEKVYGLQKDECTKSWSDKAKKLDIKDIYIASSLKCYHFRTCEGGKPPFNPPFKRADRLIMRWCYHRESEVSMDKKYIENQYRLAVLDFQTARNEDEQWEARKTMARLEQIAAQEYGFEYADELHEKEIGRKGL